MRGKGSGEREESKAGENIRHLDINPPSLRHPVLERRVVPLIQARPHARRALELDERAPAALRRVVPLVEAPHRLGVQRREVSPYGLRCGGIGEVSWVALALDCLDFLGWASAGEVEGMGMGLGETYRQRR